MLRNLLMKKEHLLVQKLRVPGQLFRGLKKLFKNANKGLVLQECRYQILGFSLFL